MAGLRHPPEAFGFWQCLIESLALRRRYDLVPAGDQHRLRSLKRLEGGARIVPITY